MQNIFFKIVILLIIINLLNHKISKSQNQQINLADSLFDQNKYTESYRRYEKIFNGSKIFTFQMLLKMAFIKEGLNDYTLALYYLNVYYLKDPDIRILDKMDKMAKKYKLKGYKVTEWNHFYSYYFRYHFTFSLILILGAIIFFAIIIYKYTFKKRIKASYRIAFILYLILVYYVNNFSKSYSWAIIKNDSSLIMRSPAAGSELVENVEKGHKLKVIGNYDIWYKVLWKEEPDPWYKILLNNEPDAWYKIIWKKQPAYIRQNNVMLIE